MKQSHKTLLLWVLLIMMFLAIWQFLSPAQTPATQVAYSEFMAQVHADKEKEPYVESVSIKDHELTYWVKERGVRGLRLFLAAERDPRWLDDPRAFSVWERAEALDIPVCVCLRFRQLPRLRTVIERFPQVRVALDHLGAPRLDDGFPYDNAGPLFELVKLNNVYLKFSSVNLYAAAKGNSTPQQFFQRLLDVFGAQRLMWGSNFPNTYDRSLKEQLALALGELSFVPEADQRWLFADTARSLWPSLA